jgi:hypothetical protein
MPCEGRMGIGKHDEEHGDDPDLLDTPTRS